MTAAVSNVEQRAQDVVLRDGQDAAGMQGVSPIVQAHFMKAVSDFLRAGEEMQTTAAPTALKAAPPKLGDSWLPYDPTQPSGTIPDPKNGAEAAAQMERYIKILEADGEQFNVMMNMTQYLIKCYQMLKPSELAIFEKSINGCNIGGGLSSIGQMIVSSIIGATFYSSGGDKVKTQATLDTLIAMLQQSGAKVGGGRMIDDLLTSAKIRQATIVQWMQQHTKDGAPDMSYADFLQVQKGLNDFFFGQSNAINWINLYYHNAIEDFFEKHKDTKDAYLLFLLLVILMQGGDDRGTNMGAYGNSIKKLSKGANTMTTLMNIFKQGNFTPQSAKEFFDAMHQQQNSTNADKRKEAAIIDQINSAFGNFFNCTAPMSDTTLDELYKAGKFDDLAKALNRLGPDPSDPTRKLDQWNQMVSALNQGSQAFTNQSSAVSVQLNQLTSDDNTMIAALKSMLDGIAQTNKAIADNTRGR